MASPVNASTPVVTSAVEETQLEMACQILLGICAGITADETITQQEFLFLRQWLEEHEAVTHFFPGNVIVHSVHEILEDGIIAADELAHLHDLLSYIQEGADGLESDLSDEPEPLPLCPDHEVSEIKVADHRFCFTGLFDYGSRQQCQDAIETRGGLFENKVDKGTNYLVVGASASPHWPHTTYGRKIEKAVKFRLEGYGLRIVSEDQWTQALESSTGV